MSFCVVFGLRHIKSWQQRMQLKLLNWLLDREDGKTPLIPIGLIPIKMKEPNHKILHVISEVVLGDPIYDMKSGDLSLGIHGIAQRDLGKSLTNTQ